MSNKGRGLGLGIFLLSIGIIWLLGIANIVTLSTLGAALRLWPLILVAIGLGIIFRNNGYIKATVWIVLLAVIIGYGYFVKPDWNFNLDGRNIFSRWQEDDSTGGNQASSKNTAGSNEVNTSGSNEHIVIEKGANTEKAELTLKFGATQVNLDSNTVSNNLVEADVSESLSTFIKHSESTRDDGRQANIEFTMKNLNLSNFNNADKLRTDFHISKDITWELNIDTGAVNSDMDLSALKVEKLDINTGAANYNIKLGSYNTEIKIDAGASNFKVKLPGDTGIKVKLDGALNNTNFDAQGWIKKGGWYYSPDFDSKAYKIEADVNMGVGKLTIE